MRWSLVRTAAETESSGRRPVHLQGQRLPLFFCSPTLPELPEGQLVDLVEEGRRRRVDCALNMATLVIVICTELA